MVLLRVIAAIALLGSSSATMPQTGLSHDVPLTRGSLVQWLWPFQSGHTHKKPIYRGGSFMSFEAQAKRRLNDLQVHLEISKDVPGYYNVTYCCGALVSDQVPLTANKSHEVAKVKQGSVVKVLELRPSPEDKRIRARIEDPAGWMSLENTESGHRWIERSQNFEDEVYVEQELRRVAEIMHATSGNIRIELCPGHVVKGLYPRHNPEEIFRDVRRRLMAFGIPKSRTDLRTSNDCGSQEPHISITKSSVFSEL